MQARPLLLALTLGLSTIAALAAEARIPLYQTTTITSPGTYVLTRRLTGSGPLINIAASNVTIDLNGFSLAPSSGAAVQVLAFDRVTIHDGFITGGDTGISLSDVEGARIERVLLANQSGVGISAVDTTGLTIRETIVRATGGDGIFVDAANLVDPAVVEIVDNQIFDVGAMGINANSIGSSVIASNSIATTVDRGMTVNLGRGVMIEDNIVRETGLGGIAVLATLGSQIFDNVVRNSGTDGIVIDAGSTDNTASRNQITNATGNGLQVGGDRNVIENNLLNGNTGGWGFFLNANSADNVFRGNMVRGNGGGACAGGSADFCDSGANNTSAGDNFAPALL